ncbi:MAPEG family protein [Pararhizobium sp.]|uniref:MAPEG family protein n=1 Tax=Pararhizobium sp. TaxID=1977563 RepID=UPI0027239E7C|nr:MAPEG family protein [Pararhizobium sp.]MDO9415577.1 MAPEG family protein [Pararhizobium sp.]
MSQTTLIFWPMIAQAALVFIIYILLGKRRFGAVRSGAAQARDYKIPSIEPEPTATVARNLINQFELPVLFFVVCLSLHLTAGVNYITVLIAWFFVVTRYAHAFVHVTSNRLMIRQRLFMVGVFAVFALWAWLAINLAIR